MLFFLVYEGKVKMWMNTLLNYDFWGQDACTMLTSTTAYVPHKMEKLSSPIDVQGVMDDSKTADWDAKTKPSLILHYVNSNPHQMDLFTHLSAVRIVSKFETKEFDKNDSDTIALTGKTKNIAKITFNDDHDANFINPSLPFRNTEDVFNDVFKDSKTIMFGPDVRNAKQLKRLVRKHWMQSEKGWKNYFIKNENTLKMLDEWIDKEFSRRNKSRDSVRRNELLSRLRTLLESR